MYDITSLFRNAHCFGPLEHHCRPCDSGSTQVTSGGRHVMNTVKKDHKITQLLNSTNISRFYPLEEDDVVLEFEAVK